MKLYDPLQQRFISGRKPPVGTPLIRTHPLARDLNIAFLMNEGAGDKLFDSSGNNQTGTFLNAGVTWTPGGLYYEQTVASVTANWTRANVAEGTIIASVAPSLLVDDELYLWDTYGGGNKRCLCYYLHRIPRLQIFTDTNARFTYEDSEAFVADEDTAIAFTWPDSRCYRNGVLLGDGTDGTLGDSSSILYLGSKYLGNGECLDGRYNYFFHWNRKLSAEEIAAHFREPYQMFGRSAPIFAVTGGAVTTPQTVSGDMPAATGSLMTSFRTSQALAGEMPAATGSLATEKNPVVAAGGKIIKIIGSGFNKILG